MRKILFALIAVVLVGCATPYQPFELFGRGGYTDKQLAPDMYQVGFYANGPTKIETINTLLAYRTAEITLDKGFDYFEVLQEAGRFPMSALGGFKIVQHVVRLHKGEPPAGASRSFSARKIKDEYGPFVAQQK